MQTILVNGVTHTLQASNVAQALDELGYGDASVATALNSRFVAAANRATTTLTGGDSLEIVAPMQGG